MTQVAVNGGSQVRSHYYCYDAARRLTNVKTGNCSGTSVVGLGYDAQGNLANRNGTLYGFDYGNRLREVTGKETYRYDGQGRRVESLGSTYAVWIYSNAGQLMFSHDARNNRATNYVYLGGSLVGLREKPMSGGTTETVRYQHTDAQGTPIATTDASKAVVDQFEYEPYGQLVNATLRDGPGYTGHVQDAATGLTYMQQRYYDPLCGCFLSVDPVTAYDSGDWRQFNRYAYAVNNPYKFTDPDGRLVLNAIGGIVGGVVGGIGGGATAFITSGGDWKKAGIGALGGAVGGAITGVTLGAGSSVGAVVAAGIVGGLSGEVVAQGAENVIEHGSDISSYEVSPGRMAVAGLTGSLSAVGGGLVDEAVGSAMNQFAKAGVAEAGMLVPNITIELTIQAHERQPIVTVGDPVQIK